MYKLEKKILNYFPRNTSRNTTLKASYVSILYYYYYYHNYDLCYYYYYYYDHRQKLKHTSSNPQTTSISGKKRTKTHELSIDLFFFFFLSIYLSIYVHSALSRHFSHQSSLCLSSSLKNKQLFSGLCDGASPLSRSALSSLSSAHVTANLLLVRVSPAREQRQTDRQTGR